MADRDVDPEEASALMAGTLRGIWPVADEVARIFYERLFALDPSLRPLFTGDMRAQGRKLMSALMMVAQNAARPEVLGPIVEALGRRHVRYGVRDEHYDTVRAALLWTLRRALGEELAPAAEAAWEQTYDRVAARMKAAAREAPPSSRRSPPSRGAPASTPP